MPKFSLQALEETIAARIAADDDASWTARLARAGQEKAAKKLGEEAVETVIAAIRDDRGALVSESADLIYHWLVVLAVAGISLDEVVGELERRTGRSGLAEKAARKNN